jgi:hypothetical protein
MRTLWAAFAALGAFALGLLAATALGMVQDEARARLGRLPGFMLRLAILRLPKDLRGDLGDEWRNELEAITDDAEGLPVTGLTKALWFAVGLVLRGPAIARAFAGTERAVGLAWLRRHARWLTRAQRWVRGRVSWAGRQARRLARRLGPALSPGSGLRGWGAPSVSSAGVVALRSSVTATAAAVLAIAVAVAMQTALTPRSAQPPTAGSPAVPAAGLAPQAAATVVAGLLAQSSSDRGAVNQAYNDVFTCGPGLGQDATTFQQAAASRQALLSQLASLRAPSLPRQMIGYLVAAWNASITADDDYARWAQDEAADGCTSSQGPTSDPNFTATAASNELATTAKANFVAAWNVIAAKYGLPTYAMSQL